MFQTTSTKIEFILVMFLVSVGDENVRNNSLLNAVELLATPERPLNEPIITRYATKHWILERDTRTDDE